MLILLFNLTDFFWPAAPSSSSSLIDGLHIRLIESLNSWNKY